MLFLSKEQSRNNYVINVCFSGVTLLEGARGQGMAGCPIEGFFVTSYQANFASHPTRDRHVSFLFAYPGINTTKCSCYFLYSSYHKTKLGLSDKNIKTHTRLKF